MGRHREETMGNGVRFIIEPPLFLFALGAGLCTAVLYGVVTLLFTPGLSFEQRLLQWIGLSLGLPMIFFLFQIPLLITSEIVEVTPEFLCIRWDFLGIGYTWQYELPQVYAAGYSPYTYEGYSHTITFQYRPEWGQTHAFGRYVNYATAQRILDTIQHYQMSCTAPGEPHEEDLPGSTTLPHDPLVPTRRSPAHRESEPTPNEEPTPKLDRGITVYRWLWSKIGLDIAFLLLLLILFARSGRMPLWLFVLLAGVFVWGTARSRQTAIFIEAEQVRYTGLQKTEIVIPLREIKEVEVRYVFSHDALRLQLHSGQFVDLRFLKKELAHIAAHIQEAAKAAQQAP